MAISRIQGTTGTTGATFPSTLAATAFGATATVGNTIIVALMVDGLAATAATTMTDNKGNVYTLRSTVFAVNIDQVDVWSAPITTGGTGLIVTAGGIGGTTASMILEEWSGLINATILDQQITGANTATTALSIGPTAATTNTTDLIWLAFGATTATGTTTTATGFSNATLKVSNPSTLYVQSKVVGIPGTQSAATTLSVSGAWEGCVVAFKGVVSIARIPTQDATGSGGASATATYPATPTAGNLLIAVQANNNLSNGLANAGWTFALSGLSNSASTNLSVLYKVAGSGEPTVITTVTDAGAGVSGLAIYEYNGFTGTPTLDKIVSLGAGTAALTAPTGTTATTTAAAELLFAAAQFSVANTVSSWSNSFVARNSVTGAGLGQYTADLVVAATGAYSTTLTTTGTANINAAGLATFKGVVAVAPALRNLMLLGIGS